MHSSRNRIPRWLRKAFADKVVSRREMVRLAQAFESGQDETGMWRVPADLMPAVGRLSLYGMDSPSGMLH